MTLISSLKNNIKHSKPFFLWARHKELSGHPGQAGTPQDAFEADALRSLTEDGVFVFPDFFSAEKARNIHDALLPQAKALASNNFTYGNKTFAEEGQFRILEANKLCPAASDFFDDQRIARIGSLYARKTLQPYQKMVELRSLVGVPAISDTYHFDDWRHRFKAFLYLTDVKATNAPVTYLKGSHRALSWRDQKEYEYFRDGKKGSYGIFLPHEIRNIKSKYGFQELSVLAKAGTLILLDTRGVHRGTVLQSAYRLMLATYYQVPRLVENT